MSWLRRYRDPVLCTLLLALPFFFLRANTKDDAELNALDRVLLKIGAPVQYAAAATANAVSDAWEGYVYLVDVRAANDRLQASYRRLGEQNHRYLRMADENARLRRLLEFRASNPGDYVSAEVIATDATNLFRVARLRVDRGERDGVRAGMPVVSADGLVGQVLRAWGAYADVRLTIDTSSQVDVAIARNGARGILHGTGVDDGYRCKLEYVLRTDEVNVGDEVITSGIGRRYPYGLAVGRVTKVERREAGLYQEAFVSPSVNFSRLDEALILTSTPPEGADVWGPPDAARRN